MGLILSDTERERDCITFNRVGRVGERRNFQISDAKMKLPVPNWSGRGLGVKIVEALATKLELPPYTTGDLVSTPVESDDVVRACSISNEICMIRKLQETQAGLPEPIYLKDAPEKLLKRGSRLKVNTLLLLFLAQDIAYLW